MSRYQTRAQSRSNPSNKIVAGFPNNENMGDSEGNHAISSHSSLSNKEIILDHSSNNNHLKPFELILPSSPLSSTTLYSPSLTPLSPSLSSRTAASSFFDNDDQFVEDVSVSFLYQTHTLLALGIILITLLYFAFHSANAGYSTETNIKLALVVIALFLLLLGLLIFPSGPFIRPHPLLWRFAFGLGVLYELVLIFLLFQSKADARAFLKYVYPSLGSPLAERSYAANCDFEPVNEYNSTQSKKDVVFAVSTISIVLLLSLLFLSFESLQSIIWNNVDIFFVGHLVGWTLKALMLRDFWLCWAISIQWELIEMVFTHMLPNFAECWWDSWLLDVAISNGLGIYFGCQLCHYLEMKEYRWSSIYSIPTLSGKITRGIMQFTPASWIKVRWESTSTIKRFLAVNAVVWLLNLEELNAFFLKALLWIPPPNSLNMIRLLIWFLIGLPALRQFYIYNTVPTSKRIGMFTFLSATVLSTELFLIFKLGQEEFPAKMPLQVRIWVGVGFLVYALFLLYFLLRIGSGSTNPLPSPTPELVISPPVENSKIQKKE